MIQYVIVLVVASGARVPSRRNASPTDNLLAHAPSSASRWLLAGSESSLYEVCMDGQGDDRDTLTA